MLNQGNFLLGVLVGAGAMYLIDPDRGRRRRALIRDQMVHGAHELEDLGVDASARARDLRNRTAGAVHESRSRIRREVVDDSVLEARVHTALGRLSSNPGAIEVSADHGRVVLSGQALEREMDQILTGVEKVRGVHDLVNRLDAQPESSNAPDVQGTNR